MDALAPELQHAATIRNKAWMVRHYPRAMQRELRARAIRELGLAVRAAFNASDDFEPLLAAVVDGLAPRAEPPAF